jgi:hypothetical protein
MKETRPTLFPVVLASVACVLASLVRVGGEPPPEDAGGLWFSFAATGVFLALAFWMGKAGFPADMVNRKVDDADAPGGGFMPGSQITKEVGGAQKHGFYMKPDAVGTDWQPGDAYHVDHPPKANSDHVGVVVAATPNADGSVTIETGDGGQGSGADIKRTLRTLSADGKTLTNNETRIAARVLGIIRASDATA